jgi:hypothetical protein
MRLASLVKVAAALAAATVAAQAPVALAVTSGSDARGAAGARGTHLPYTDPNQAGWLTLCGTNLKSVSSGSIKSKPFVWRVVSDVPAPQGYFVKGAKATMFAYQPRQGTPAGAWSGTVMAAASYYYDRAHPMAQFTPIDAPLTQMTKAYPPRWDHLIELRLYLSAPQIPVLMDHYAAADIQVIGKTWRLVAGGHSSCTAGKVVAVETSVGMPGSRSKPKQAPSASPSASPSRSPGKSSSRSQSGPPSPGTSPAGVQPTSPGSPGATTPAGAVPPGTAPTALSRSSSDRVITIVIAGASVITIVLLSRLLWRRQRRETG